MNYIILDIETTGVNPFLDEIICIGLMDYKGNVLQLYKHNRNIRLEDTRHFISEKDMIEEAVNIIKIRSDIDCVMGWKISKFDIPFIRARAFKYGIDNSDVEYVFGDVGDIMTYDLYYAFDEYAITPDQIRSDYISKFLDIDVPHDDISGSDVPFLYKIGAIKDILEHNKKDLIRCKLIYKRL